MNIENAKNLILAAERQVMEQHKLAEQVKKKQIEELSALIEKRVAEIKKLSKAKGE